MYNNDFLPTPASRVCVFFFGKYLHASWPRIVSKAICQIFVSNLLINGRDFIYYYSTSDRMFII